MGSTPFYYTSTDGVTWTKQTPGFFGAHDQVEGLTWYAAAGLWILAVQTAWTTTPATCAFYSSPDGFAWTRIATGPGAVYLADLESVGNALVCTLQDGNAAGGGSGSNPSGQIVSDDNGATWGLSGGNLLANVAGSTRGYTRPRLVAGPNGLMAVNTSGGRWSHQVGALAPLT